MNGWRAAVGAAVWAPAFLLAIWMAVGNEAPWVVDLAVFWLPLLWPLFMLLNWSTTWLCIRRFQRGLEEAGLPASAEPVWGFVKMRGGAFRTSQALVLLHVRRGLWQARRRVTIAGVAGGLDLQPLTGYQAAARDAAPRIQAALGKAAVASAPVRLSAAPRLPAR